MSEEKAAANVTAPPATSANAPTIRVVTPEDKWIIERFRAFYQTKPPAPSEIARREFGFGFEKKIDFRHKAFASVTALKESLVRDVPKYVSYSAAYYDLPGARPMERKGYRGADLVFDLDTSYAHEPHDHLDLLCPYCLNRVKDDARRLAEEYLVKDFGLGKDEIWIKFSGSKGYHLHVQSEVVRDINAEGRRQLLGYLTGEGVNLDRLLVKQPLGQGRFKLQGPTIESKGWGKKVYLYTQRFLKGATVEQITEKGVRKVDAAKIVEGREFLLTQMERGNWDVFPGLRKLWASIIDEAKRADGIEVDQGVTFDLARIIRLEDSIHGDTGLVAKKVGTVGSLDRFDPLRDALSTDPRRKVSVVPNSDARFEIAGQAFELKGGAAVEVPEPAALALLCKHRAKLA